MIHHRRAARASAALALAIAGCHAPPRAALAPETTPSLPACPAPALDPADWPRVSDSAGLTYRLPSEYVAKPPGARTRRWDLAGDFQQSVEVGFIHSQEPVVTFRRAPSIGMRELSECIDSVAGREIVVQAWRTVGGTFRFGRRLDKYEAFALIPVAPGLIAYLTGGGYEQRAQQLALAVVRTFEVSTR